MSICYHGFSETPGPSKDCEVCIAYKERDLYKTALEKYVNVFLPGGVCPANEALHPVQIQKPTE